MTAKDPAILTHLSAMTVVDGLRLRAAHCTDPLIVRAVTDLDAAHAGKAAAETALRAAQSRTGAAAAAGLWDQPGVQRRVVLQRPAQSAADTADAAVDAAVMRLGALLSIEVPLIN